MGQPVRVLAPEGHFRVLAVEGLDSFTAGIGVPQRYDDRHAVRRDAGMSPEQISRETGIKPYPLGRYLTALRQIPDGALSRALDLAAEADAGVKGYSKDYIPIERFICAL